jgi:hypothetical protein
VKKDQHEGELETRMFMKHLELCHLSKTKGMFYQLAMKSVMKELVFSDNHALVGMKRSAQYSNKFTRIAL